MSNPTSNFGWQMPTPTDLVTDLPADFEVFGQAVDSTMADLKGGTSGQILSKNSNTDMDFVWITNDQGDITGVTAGTGISGGGTSGTVTITNSMATEITAKGDLIVGTGSATFDNLAAGANGSTLVADSSTSTGLRYQAPVNANPVLNASMQLAQRGTTFTSATGLTYTLDRWQGFRGSSAAYSISQQATNDTTNLPFIQYCARVGRPSGNTATQTTYIGQSFESINSIPYAGKTVTLSFYARAGANFSANSNVMSAAVVTGTGTDQNIYNGFTGGADTVLANATLTTTWQRFTATATIPTGTKQLGLYFAYVPTGTAGANDYFEVTGAQIEVGSVATPFKTYAGTIQGELAACQRYYYRWTAANLSTGYIANGANLSTSASYAIIRMPVPLRTNPSLETSGTASNYRLYNGGSNVTCTSVPAIDQAHNETPSVSFTASSSLTVGYASYIGANSTTAAFLGFNAEL